ncbi:MAG: 50S ribosomal protein L10 [Thermodesulfobacteriota bacterium]|nr:MAG: 50S ribosomal protein L10 [Thermodesulfobacteriota bacterium]
MDRTDKEKYVEDLKGRLDKSGATFLAEYSGVKAVEMNEFRSSLRETSAEFMVVRNTLARIALKDTAQAHLTEYIKGSVALAFSYKDAALAAKKLMEFAKDQPGVTFKAATLGERVLGADEIKALAELPSKEVLLAKMIGSINAPLTGLVGVLSGVPRKLLYTLNAIRDAKSS